MIELRQKLNSYTVKVIPLSSEEGSGFKATYDELGLTVRGIGTTVAEAVSELEDVALDTLIDLPLVDFPAARQESPWASYSGRVTLRLPKMLHAQLDCLADEQGVSLNQLMTHALQSAATTMLAGEEFGVCSRHGADALAESVASIRGLIDVWSVAAFYDVGKRQKALQPFPGRRSAQLHYASMELQRA